MATIKQRYASALRSDKAAAKQVMRQRAKMSPEEDRIYQAFRQNAQDDYRPLKESAAKSAASSRSSEG